MSTSSDKPFLIIWIARNAEWSQETDLHLITILNFCVGIVMGNVIALRSESLWAKSNLICIFVNWICPSRDHMNQ